MRRSDRGRFTADGTPDRPPVVVRAEDGIARAVGLLDEAQQRWHRATTDEDRWLVVGEAQSAVEVLLDVRAALDEAVGALPDARPVLAELWHRSGVWIGTGFLLTAQASVAAGDPDLARASLDEAVDVLDACLSTPALGPDDRAQARARRREAGDLRDALAS